LDKYLNQENKQDNGETINQYKNEIQKLKAELDQFKNANSKLSEDEIN